MKKLFVLTEIILFCLLSSTCVCFEPIMKELFPNEEPPAAETVPEQIIENKNQENQKIRIHSEFDEYKQLNKMETRLMEYKDSDEMLLLKLHQLEYINRSRSTWGVPPVKLDILASRVANRMCREAGENGFTGHWNTRGEKPYHRYAFAGGTDHVSENASAAWSSAPFVQSLENCQMMMIKSHDNFMAEQAPNDGHKQNCINVFHNYAGLGVYLAGGEFRYYEEFIDRYVEFFEIPADVPAGVTDTLSIKPINNAHHIIAVISYWEPFPEPLTPREINERGSYPDFTGTQVHSLWPWELEAFEEDGILEIPLKFSKRGLYYINIYVSDKKYTGGSISTEGSIQASGVVTAVR